MPAVNFDVRWPDGELVQYYSPSTVITSRLEVGRKYTMSDFYRIVDDALSEASERVKNKFGYYCSAAASEQSKISAKVHMLKSKDIDGSVIVVSIN